MDWKINSWSNYIIRQIPHYDTRELQTIQAVLKQQKPLIDIDSIMSLKNKLLDVQKNNSFIVQMGECAETFEQCTAEDILNRILLIQDFKNILSDTKDIITIGRIAGQYAKPRSNALDDNNLPVYKGDMVHDFTLRKIDASRLLLAYEKSKDSLAYINQHTREMYISHEALILPYEECFTYPINNKYYNLSAPMLWLGDKTCFENSAHLEYLRGIENVVGIKISSQVTPTQLRHYINTLNPDNHSNKIILINRMGVKNINQYLPPLLKAIKQDKLNVNWMCDPMHGNTFTSNNNYKTRDFNDILQEIRIFDKVLREHNTYFSGIHLETTYKNVTECIDNTIHNKQLNNNYETFCDPRLNKKQTLNIALALKELL